MKLTTELVQMAEKFVLEIKLLDVSVDDKIKLAWINGYTARVADEISTMPRGEL